MKKGSYYFGLLTEEEKDNYKEAVNHKRFLNFLMENKDFDSLKDFLLGSLVWDETPQGHDYWQNIANSNRENIEG